MAFSREDAEPIHPERLPKLFDQHAKDSWLNRIRVHHLRHTGSKLTVSFSQG